MSKSIAELEKHAEEIRKDLNVPKQTEVFQIATEAGYLSAIAGDGKLDEEEQNALVKAIEILSKGVVLEWEVESLLDKCAETAKAEGADKRAEAVGAKFKALDQGEAGLLFAAFVAEASGGIDKKESAVLHTIGKAAGLAKNKVSAILKRVGAAVE